MHSCPTCGGPLGTKTVKTVASGSLEVDMCESCGGVFFDRGEINRLSKTEAEKLAHVKTTNRTDPHGSNHCPKCGASLERYWGESVPNDVYVLRCPDCSGTFFTKEDLSKFKTAQQAKIDYFKLWKIPLSSLSSVLIPVALFTVLSGMTLFTVSVVQKNQSVRSLANEILTTPSVIPDPKNPTSITLVFTTRKSATTELTITDYKGVTGTTTLIVSKNPSETHQIKLENVERGKTYSYKIHVVTGEEAFISEEYTFTVK